MFYPVFGIVNWEPWDEKDVAPKALPPGGVTPDDPRTMMGSEFYDDAPFDDGAPFNDGSQY